MSQSIRIDIVHGFHHQKPSLKNLQQGLEGLDNQFEIHTHNLRTRDSIDTPIDQFLELLQLHKNGLRTLLRIRDKSDILIIHKFIFPRDLNLLERLFLWNNTVVYSVYDAEYLSHPRKTSLLCRESDLVIAISHEIAAYAREHSNSVALIPPSVDTEFFCPMDSAKLKFEGSVMDLDDKFVIGWIGNAMDHQQDIEFVLDILSNMENIDEFAIRLLCGGEVPHGIQTMVDDIDIESDLIEWVPRSDVPKIINTFDVGVAPLRDTVFNQARSSEKIREYLSCGCPVVASDIGENRYLVPESAGYVLDAKDSWVETFRQLADSPEARTTMGKQAREHAKNMYSINVASNRIEEEFSELLTEKGES